eukprot:TRINITY_DN33760_c0_g1_i1.p1 TRINITY_DN33760_c0_g1~~TRINITY_DN33760_c0_g1_i1.p1  ORF type:complete len:119 (-),score=40.99 TRINITY_DN33760_c0_g1_i1:57-380(-)
MLRSLVGSEMCIRDSSKTVATDPKKLGVAASSLIPRLETERSGADGGAPSPEILESPSSQSDVLARVTDLPEDSGKSHVHEDLAAISPKSAEGGAQVAAPHLSLIHI